MTGLFLGLELVSWRRDRRLIALLAAVMVALVVATTWATAGDIAQRDAQQAASLEARAQWEGFGPANPHGMAHFGDFAFRPSGPLARLDRGVQSRLGKVLRLEGHRQGTPVHSDTAKAGTLARFDRLDAAFLLQTLVPLLLIFLGSTGLAADRDTGRLKLSLVQGAAARAILGGRFLALWGLGLLLIGLVGLASLTTSAAFGGDLALAGDRLVGMVMVHSLFLAVISAGIVAATVWLEDARSALLVLLALWVVGTAVLPRATAGAAGALYALPSQDAFQAQLKEARQAGPDGHNPQDATLAELRQDMLKKHGVEAVEELPLNFDGIRMQVDEEFGNRVWDEHYGDLRQQMGRQRAFASGAAWINPFQAVDHLSMALAGTDLAHDIAFQRQAEAYRRTMVDTLNQEHAYGGSKTGEWSWKAPAAFFAGMAPFHYTSPSLAEALRPRWSELGALALWATLLLIAMFRGADRLERGTLPC